MDKRTARGLRDVVEAGVLGSPLQSAALGRGLRLHGRVRKASRGSRHKRGALTRKDTIKRVDRLLGNKRLHEALPEAWRLTMQPVVERKRSVHVLIDWTGGAEGSGLWTLSAALARAGRAVRIYEEAVHVSALDTPAVRQAFLARLKRVLPRDSHVVVVADAGFRIPFMREVEALGWDYVIRVRGPLRNIRLARSTPTRKALLARASEVPKSWGPARLGCEAFACAQLVTYRAPSRGRKAKSRKGTPLLWNHSRKYARSAREGWLLATSLHHAAANEIRDIYATRMTLEEAFRDVKSPRFGLGLSLSRTRSPQRFAVLCLIGALVALVLDRLGRRCERTAWAYSLQANSLRSRPVLSCTRLGRALIHEAIQIAFEHLLSGPPS